MNHASNVCGVIAPIESICSMSHQYGAVNIIDMCQTAGLIDTDLSSGIYDFAVFAGHKTLYATFGIAGFICSDNIGQVLIEQGIEVRTGLHCSPSSHKFLGTFPAGTVRFSVGYFNDDDDFRMLDEALDYIYENSW
jgi:selenocysteine lyase/cysteine desulfurase